MLARGDCVTIHLPANPDFKPGLRFSYESVLCRIHGGYWMMGEGTITVKEIIALKVDPC